MRLLSICLTFMFIQVCFSQSAEDLLLQSSTAEEQNDIETAITLLSQAFQKTSDTSELINIGFKMSSLHSDLGDEEEALETLSALMSIHSEPDSLNAQLLHKSGVAWYNLDEYQKAIEYWEQAIEVRTPLLCENHIDNIRSITNIGTAYKALQAYDRSSSFLKKSIDKHLQLAYIDSALLARTYLDMAEVSCQLEDIDQATIFMPLARSLYLRLYPDDPIELPFLYDTENIYYSRIGQYHEAIKTQKEKINLLSSYEELYNEDIVHIAQGYNNIGISYDLLSDYPSAIEAYEKAIMYNLMTEEVKGTDLFDIYSNMAEAYSQKGAIDSALYYWTLASGSYDIEEDKSRKLSWLVNGAEYHSKKGNIEKAEELLDNLTMHFTHENAIQDPILDLEVLFLKASISRELFDKSENIAYLKSSTDQYLLSLEKISSIVSTYISDKSKIHLNKKIIEQYEKGIESFVLLNEVAPDPTHIRNALSLSEKAKSIALISALSDNRLKSKSNIPKRLLLLESKLKKNIAQVKREHQETDRNVDKELAVLNIELEEVQNIITADYPKYSTMRTSLSNDHLTSISTQKDVSIIEYFMGKNALYSFTIHDGIIQYQSVSNNGIRDLVKSIRTSIAASFLYDVEKDHQKSDSTLGVYTRDSYRLYENILKPIKNNITLHEKLIIVPDAELNYLPFDVLTTENSELNEGYGGLAYLINEHQISYTYSLALLDEMREKVISPKDDFVGFAPTFNLNSTATEYGERGIKSSKLSPLYFNIKEVTALTSIIEGDLFIDSMATEENFRNHAGSYNIIHLSTHGKANDEMGDYSYLAFTPIADSIENEFIYNQDLYQLELNANMVVLSACETGIGELKRGEGIISLARGFSYAGAKSIITTLWSINDLKTKVIMESFYEFIDKSLAKDDALRKAKLQFIHSDTSPLPFYWAAFIPIGDMSPIHKSIKITNTLAIALGISLVLLSIFLLYRRSQNG